MADYDIIGILESRLQGEVMSSGTIYDMYASGADLHGCCGSQLWVRRSLRAQVGAITPHSPRLLTGVVYVGGVSFGAIVAHSPHEWAPAADKNHFYKSLEAATRQLQSRKRIGACVLLADMNARVGSITSPSIGACGKADENDNGARMRIFLQCQGMCAVNTMCAGGCGPTWTGSRGHKARLDYIGISIPVLPNVSACYVDRTVDLATAVRDDHAVVVVDILPPTLPDDDTMTDVPKAGEQKKTAQRPLRLDAATLADHDKCADFPAPARSGL